MIEQATSPTAVVQHDIKLPVLGKKRVRQCDVVIRFGKPPRQTIAIVEVQKRGKRPEITTFHGWVQKMREVGAQHLFCVSEAGYPESIVEEVATVLGPTVRLLTLKNLPLGLQVNPFRMHPAVINTNPKFKIKAVTSLKLLNPEVPVTDVEIRSDEQVFFRGQGAPMKSLNEIMAEFVNSSSDLPRPAPHEMSGWHKDVEINLSGGAELMLQHQNLVLRVGELTCLVELTCEAEIIPIEVDYFIYEQELIDGNLAWITKTVVENNNQKVQLTVIIRPNEDGYLHTVGFFADPIH